MHQFQHPNMTNFSCPVCATSADYPVVLIAVPGTQQGNIVEAKQVHTECAVVFCKMHGVELEIEPLEGIKNSGELIALATQRYEDLKHKGWECGRSTMASLKGSACDWKRMGPNEKVCCYLPMEGQPE